MCQGGHQGSGTHTLCCSGSRAAGLHSEGARSVWLQDAGLRRGLASEGQSCLPGRCTAAPPPEAQGGGGSTRPHPPPPAPTRPRLRGGLAAGQSHPVSGHPAHPAPTPPGWGTRGSSVAAPISCRPGSRGERAATAPTRLPVVNVRTSQPVGRLTSYRNQGSLPLCGRSVSGKREPRFTSCRWSPFPMRGPQELSCWLL